MRGCNPEEPYRLRRPGGPPSAGTDAFVYTGIRAELNLPRQTVQTPGLGPHAHGGWATRRCTAAPGRFGAGPRLECLRRKGPQPSWSGRPDRRGEPLHWIRDGLGDRV